MQSGFQLSDTCKSPSNSEEWNSLCNCPLNTKRLTANRPNFQAEQEVQNLMRKLKLLENDLDQAEDKAAEATSKLKDLETQYEEAEREKKQMQRRIDVLEGMPYGVEWLLV